MVGTISFMLAGQPATISRQIPPVLKDFNTLIDGQLLYYNTDSDQLDRESRKILFDKLGIPGTPRSIRLKMVQLVSGYLGSAPDAQAIYQAVFKEKLRKQRHQREQR